MRSGEEYFSMEGSAFDFQQRHFDSLTDSDSTFPPLLSAKCTSIHHRAGVPAAMCGPRSPAGSPSWFIIPAHGRGEAGDCGWSDQCRLGVTIDISFLFLESIISMNHTEKIYVLQRKTMKKNIRLRFQLL